MHLSRHNQNPLEGYVAPPWVRVLHEAVSPAPLPASRGVPLCELFSRRELARLAWVRHAVTAGMISEGM